MTDTRLAATSTTPPSGDRIRTSAPLHFTSHESRITNHESSLTNHESPLTKSLPGSHRPRLSNRKLPLLEFTLTPWKQKAATRSNRKSLRVANFVSLALCLTPPAESTRIGAIIMERRFRHES
jgi:hypothetical protein